MQEQRGSSLMQWATPAWISWWISPSFSPVPQLYRYTYSSMYSMLSQAISSIGSRKVSSQVASTHLPSRYFMCYSLISRKRLTAKVRMWPNFCPMNLQSLFLISPRVQAREYPFSKSFSCSLPQKWLVQATPGFLVWQTTFRILKTCLPRSQSSPLMRTAISFLEQQLTMAFLMLGTAVIRSLFWTTKYLSGGSFEFLRKIFTRSPVPSSEASSTTMSLQFWQFWLRIDWRLYSQRQFLALFLVDTMTQMGSSFSNMLKWYVLSSLSISFCTSYSMCLFSNVSMKGVLRLRRLIAQGFLIFYSWKSFFFATFQIISIFRFLISSLE